MATVAVVLDVGLEIIMWPWLDLAIFFVFGLGKRRDCIDKFTYIVHS